ncbi:phosphopantetheine-binding protein [Amycolatopsis sp. NPDC049688]|uniref:phosphopantetheine-binding protein n=1 Tax=Amycolatopsis sp. NPDC049688 TaxID=3154733 RepID=UPI00343BC808
MTQLTMSDLVALLRECAGEDEAVDLDGDIGAVPFEELGYDSLAVLNTTGRVERDYSIQLGDEIVAVSRNPDDLLRAINDRLRERV